MNNSYEFINNSYEDKIDSLRQGRWVAKETIFDGANRASGGSLARMRTVLSAFVGGNRDRDIRQS